MERLLVSVRGPNEALAAAEGGAHIADVEYRASALGTPYPLSIRAVRRRLDDAGFKDTPISTNIGEEHPVRRTACQAALGVAVAGADYIKFGLAGFKLKSAIYLGRNLVRSVREWFPDERVCRTEDPAKEFATSLEPLVPTLCASAAPRVKELTAILGSDTLPSWTSVRRVHPSSAKW